MSEKRRRFTPTQLAILNILSDGKPHTKSELCTCFLKYDTSPETLKTHISYLRNIIRSDGHDIVCVFLKRLIHYQHVILLPSARIT